MIYTITYSTFFISILKIRHSSSMFLIVVESLYSKLMLYRIYSDK